MNERARTIAGFFALVAMTFALAETVLASTCDPAMDMGDSSAAVAAQSHDAMLGPSHAPERQDGREDGRTCPISPAAAQACGGAASLPAHALAVPALSPEGVAGIFFHPTQHDLLLGDTLFHPPRA